MSINYSIIAMQEHTIQASYCRTSNGTEFDTKNDESLANFIADFLGVDVDHLYLLSFSPFGKNIKLNHNPTDSTIIMVWEHNQ